MVISPDVTVSNYGNIAQRQCFRLFALLLEILKVIFDKLDIFTLHHGSDAILQYFYEPNISK